MMPLPFGKIFNSVSTQLAPSFRNHFEKRLRKWLLDDGIDRSLEDESGFGERLREPPEPSLHLLQFRGFAFFIQSGLDYSTLLCYK